MGDDPTALGIEAAGARLRDGRLSAAALLGATLARIGRVDPAIGAFVSDAPARAAALAARADAELAVGTPRGPLHGIPFAVKDLIDVAGLPTGSGSRSRDAAASAAAEDASVVRRLVDAGAVPVGKVATYELGLVGPSDDGPAPPPRNPRDRMRITGGSSSGSAAAVAAGLVRVSLGTDTGGSVRSPAAYCGVAGLKPTFGALPLAGVQPLAPSLDHVGVIAASVREAALAFAALAGSASAGPAPGDARAAPDLSGLSIGYARDWFAHDPALEPDVLAALDRAVGALSLLGARVRPATLPEYAPLERAGGVVIEREAYEVHREALAAGAAGYGRQALECLGRGGRVGPDELARARRIGADFRAAVDAGPLADHDVLVTACTLTVAPPFSAFAPGAATWTPMRTLPFDVSGHPALSCPVEPVAGGLPVGLQIVGRHGDEAGVCRVGEALERRGDSVRTASWATPRRDRTQGGVPRGRAGRTARPPVDIDGSASAAGFARFGGPNPLVEQCEGPYEFGIAAAASVSARPCSRDRLTLE